MLGLWVHELRVQLRVRSGGQEGQGLQTDTGADGRGEDAETDTG